MEVVRLAPTPTAILVPTERGRLAIAAADEKGLLDALSRAARARQRLEDLTREAPPVVEPTRPVEVEVTPALMTGIERALFEDRMAEERAAALGAAEGERIAAVAGLLARSTRGAGAELATAQAETVRRSKAPAASPIGPAAPDRASRCWCCRWSGPAQPGASPSCSTGCPTPGTDLGRLTALGLVLAGPATSVGAIMARVYWPRLVAVVVAGGLAAAVFLGRALLG